MIPDVGTTCLFTFISNFSTLDGIYRIRAETTFLDAIASNIDFVENLYIPAGLSSTEFNADYSSYTSDRVAVLESVVNTDVLYYVPQSIILNVPDPTVNEYYSLILVTKLGVFKNTQTIFPLLDSINDIIQAQLGISEPVRVVTNPENKVYLTQAQYDTIVEARAASAATISPLSVQLVQAQQQNTYLSSLVAQYEALIVQIAQS